MSNIVYVVVSVLIMMFLLLLLCTNSHNDPTPTSTAHFSKTNPWARKKNDLLFPLNSSYVYNAIYSVNCLFRSFPFRSIRRIPIVIPSSLITIFQGKGKGLCERWGWG